MDNVITVNIEIDKNKCTPNYITVLDWSKEDVLMLAEHNEPDRCFTIPFYSGDVDLIPDWSDFFKYDYNYLVQPFYLGEVVTPNIMNHALEIMGFREL